VPFPDVEYSFASYPSALLGASAELVAAEDGAERLELLLKLPLTNYLPRTRIVDRSVLMGLLEAAKRPSSLATLEAALPDDTADRQRATLAWLLKYDLLQVVKEA
jgi:hypothetical protein